MSLYPENILICIAVPLVIMALLLKGSSRRLAVSFIVGMVLCLLAAYTGGFLELRSGMGQEDTSVFIAPILEEIMKMVPIMLYLIFFEPGDNDLVLVSLGTGAGFATFENCCHILNHGSANLGYIMIRGLAVGVMHMVSVYALTLVFILLRRYKISYLSIITGALGLSVSFHALYNLLVSAPGAPSLIGYSLPIISIIFLVSIRGKIIRS